MATLTIYFTSFMAHYLPASRFSLTCLLGTSTFLNMEHKRDADAAGLTWPRGNIRTPQLPDSSSSLTPAHQSPQGTTSASTVLGSSSATDPPSTNLGMYQPQPKTTPGLRSQPPNIVTTPLLTKVVLVNDWSTRTISRFLHIPTTPKSSLSWRSRTVEFHEAKIPNISSSQCRANGSGPSIRPTTGVTTLVCPCFMQVTI